MREDYSYLKLCLRYRLISVLLSTVSYLFTAYSLGERFSTAVWVSIGMVVSCILAGYLYVYARKIKSSGRLIFVLEFMAYGFFMLISGGMKSPYLWYFISCLLIYMIEEEELYITITTIVWYMICALIGVHIRPRTYLSVNIFVGVLVLVGSMYIVNYYIRLQRKQQNFLENLNIRLQQETKRAEYALRCSTDLYDTFDLLGLSKPGRIFKHLLSIVERTVATEGFLLIKLDFNRNIEKVFDFALSEKAIEELSATVFEENFIQDIKANRYVESFVKAYPSGDFEFIALKREGLIQGILIRKQSVGGVYPNEDFYLHFIVVVFAMIDVYAQIEEYISMEEKNRIASEIHDTIIQKMFATLCSLQELELLVDEKDKEFIKDKLGIIKLATKNTMSELREAIFGIKFDENAKEGFVYRLRIYLEEISGLNSVNISTDIELEDDYISPVQKTVLYRIACEACNNSIRHGNAKNISLSLRLEAGDIVLRIVDDGLGFEQGRQLEAKGMGIKNMQKLALLLKGDLSIESASGVNIVLKLPLEREI